VTHTKDEMCQAILWNKQDRKPTTKPTSRVISVHHVENIATKEIF